MSDSRESPFEGVFVGMRIGLTFLLCMILPTACINLDQLTDATQRIAAKCEANREA